MKVEKRDGTFQSFDYNRIQQRYKTLIMREPVLDIDPDDLSKKVIEGLRDNIKTSELDELAAESAAYRVQSNIDYDTLATRISVSNLHASTPKTFKDAMYMLKSIISDDVLSICTRYENEIENEINYDRDYDFTYFGYKTLEKTYLERMDGRIIERPQHLYMRVAIGIHGDHLSNVFETYHKSSLHLMTHATPTLLNSGKRTPQLSSCFLLTLNPDSIEGIYDTLKQSALISKWAGGIGINVHSVRGNGSKIRGTNGKSDGLVPMLKVFNDTGRYVNQGGKRNGSIAIYLEPWHVDLMDFLDIRNPIGDENQRSRDLFTALWMPSLFFERVKRNEQWSFMCPDECPGLSDVWGVDFEKLYTQYEKEEKYRFRRSAVSVFEYIIGRIRETGTPYLLNKDECNAKSNQSNLGTIRNSNLCCEIVEYSDSNETAVCNLASISLPSYYINNTYDFEELQNITRILVRNLNKVIDKSFYPTKQTKTSNMKHRPIGIGVQGLHTLFLKMKLAFDSTEALELSTRISEHIYYAAVDESCLLAEKYGHYESFPGSPFSKGLLQFDLWGVTPTLPGWDELKKRVMKYGTRNSLLTAQMPTASTANIMGNSESTEMIPYNVMSRGVLAGDFVVFNSVMVKHLKQFGDWTPVNIQNILDNKGSVANLKLKIPNFDSLSDWKCNTREELVVKFKRLYRTKFEMKSRVIIDQAVARAPYIDQSQSMNLHLQNPTIGKMKSMIMYAYEQKLKTLEYYCRTESTATQKSYGEVCTEEVCTRCSS